MSSMGLEATLIVVLILANGLLSMSEIAIVSARKARLQRRVEQGDLKARVALQLATEPDQLLSTVQVGITLVGILAGAYGGATVAETLALWLKQFSWAAESSETIAVALVVVVITYLSVVVGELVPKRLALNRPEAIAIAVARPMRLLSRLAYPVVRVLSLSTGFFLWLLRIDRSAEPAVTEDEIRVLIRQGTKVGVFEEAEQEMVERVLRLGDRRVSALMTARTEVVWLDLDDPLEKNTAKMAASGHSHFPACRGSSDHIVGVVSVKDLWARGVADGRVDLESSLAKPLFVPESLPALKLLGMLQQAGTSVALVIDEYGGFLGMVTHNDVLAAIVGEVSMIELGEEPWVVERDDGSWLIDGMLPIDELRDVVDIPPLPDEDEGRYKTLAGFVMATIGRIPRAGDRFDVRGLRFEVVDMDERRVDKVLVQRLPAGTSSDEVA